MLMRNAMKLLRPKVILTVALAAGGWQVYSSLKARPVPLDAPRQEAAEKACWRAVEILPDLPEPPGPVAVLRLEGDATGYVTGKLRELIERTGRYTQPPPSLLERIKERLDVDETPVGTVEAALDAAGRLQVPYVLFGRVSGFASDQERGRIRMDLTVLDAATGAPVAPALTARYPEPSPDRGRAIWRLLLWLAVTALLPLVTLPLVRAVLERESNAATLAGLLAWTAVPVVLALGLEGFAVSGWYGWTRIAAAVIIALAYNYCVFCVVEERRH